MMLDQQHELRIVNADTEIAYDIVDVNTNRVVAHARCHLNQIYAEAHAREALRRFKEQRK